MTGVAEKFYKYDLTRKDSGYKPNFEIDDKCRKSFLKGGRYSILASFLDKNKSYDNIVEIGGAGGAHLAYLNHNYKFKDITGIDLYVDENLKRHSKIKFFEGNFDGELPIKNSSVQFLVMMMVIEHLFDPFQNFKRINTLLRKDGVAFINVPLVTNLKNRIRLLFGKLPETSISYDKWFEQLEYDGNHLHYFSLKSIKDLCEQANLEIIKYEYQGNFLFLKRLFPSLFCGEVSIAVKKRL